MIYDRRFLFVVFNIIYFTGALRWTRFKDLPISSETVVSMNSAKSAAHIDLSSGLQFTIIRNSKEFDKGLFIYCFISGYNDKDAIVYSFCKNSDDCYNPTEGSIIKITKFNLDLSIETNVMNQKGMKIEIRLTASSDDLSGIFYCKAETQTGAIRSNIIDFRDKIFWEMNLFQSTDDVDKTDIKSITLSTLPQVLKCSHKGLVKSASAPTWTKIEFFSPVSWSVCPILKNARDLSEKSKMTRDKCRRYSKDRCEDKIDGNICPRKPIQVTEWTTYVNQEGDLIFTDLRPESNSNIDSYSFLCYTYFQSETPKSIIYFYDTMEDNAVVKGISIDGATPSTMQTLEAISPLRQDFILYARQVPKDEESTSVKPVAIYALFKSSPSATSVWRLGGTKLNSNQIMTVSKYAITFPSHVTSDLAGLYTLQVTDRNGEISMTVNVQVLGPPVLQVDDCMAPLRYVWDGDSVTFTCSYKQNPTKIILKINKQEINIDDSLENSRVNLKREYPHLEGLNFVVSSTGSDPITIRYNVSGLTKTLGHAKYQDHTVSFVASNDFGMSIKSASIYVLPNPVNVVKHFPEDSSCMYPCESTKPHRFRCEITADEYADKELILDHYWTINSNRVDVDKRYAPYFRVDPVTKELTMLPIISNDSRIDKEVKELLRKNEIECNINLRPLYSGDSTFSYSSTTDKSLGDRMKAKVTLDFELPSMAHIYYIVLPILGLIILILIILLIIRHFIVNKGDVYQLDKLERAHGYDPEKEVQEELFKPYQRQDNQETNLDDHDDVVDKRLSLTDNSIGSHEDGDLDNYDHEQYALRSARDAAVRS